MKFAVSGLAMVALLGMAACANNPQRPTDVGNMTAPPVGARPGVLDTTRQTGPDVGSMALPSQSGGYTVRESPAPDTGNMALPQRAQGNSGTRPLVP